MKTFISWSGDFSHEIAKILNTWIKCVLQSCKPWLSSEDIEKGKIWFDEITDSLSETKIGILVLTKENKDKPWILFEAGALSNGLNKNKVCPILVNLNPTDIVAPLSEFNCTDLENKDDMKKFFKSLNKELEENKLEEKVFEKVFDTYWGSFNEEVKKTKKNFSKTNEIKESEDNKNKPVTGSMIDELLYEIRNIRRDFERSTRTKNSLPLKNENI